MTTTQLGLLISLALEFVGKIRSTQSMFSYFIKKTTGTKCCYQEVNQINGTSEPAMA
jgi:hypothetical protein